jgi:hypothetical protein
MNRKDSKLELLKSQVEEEEGQTILDSLPEPSKNFVDQFEKSKQNLLAALEVATQTERSLGPLSRGIDEVDALGGDFECLQEHFRTVSSFFI